MLAHRLSEKEKKLISVLQMNSYIVQFQSHLRAC